MGCRRATNDSEFVVDEGIFHGLMFGWDFTADHEWGTTQTEKAFGLKKNNLLGSEILGIKRAEIHKVPEGLHFFKNKYKGAVHHHLVLGTVWDGDFEKYEPMDVYQLEDFAVSWCDGRFSVSVKGSKNPNVKLLKELHEAILKKDVCYMWTSKTDKAGKAFGRTCPSLLITSRLDEGFKKNIYEYDLDQKKIRDAVKATGVEELLKEKGLGYYALKPSWTDKGVKETTDGRTIKTEHPVIFFLNPREQKENNSGWFTVEDLMLWPKGVGPIPLNKDSNAKDFMLTE